MEREETRPDWNLRYVICISNMSLTLSDLPITQGAIYEVIKSRKVKFNQVRPFDYTGNIFVIQDDNGQVRPYGDDNFRYLNKDELRELRLDKLGI